jgi:predicted acetyltransferase
MDLSFREATKDDLDRLLDIHLAAFPDPRGLLDRRRGFVANPFGPLEDLVVAEEDGVIVAHAFLFGVPMYFGRKAVKVGCVASVGVAPEARGRGVGSALLAQLHRLSDARGDALTMLYAFRQGFYARHGYAATTPRRRLVVDPRSIPRPFCDLARGRTRSPRLGEREAIERAYDRAAVRESGWLERPAAFWDRLFARERRHIVVLEGKVEGEIAGYVAFELAQEEAHAETTLVVDEIVADDDHARRALLGFLGTMRGQVAEIVLEVALDDPLDVALVDADGRRYGTADVEHDLGTLVGGPMVRIDDVPRAVEARGYTGSATFDVVLEGEDDSMAVSVRVEDGAAEVSDARGGPALRTSRRGLSAILYGAVRPSDAARVGLLDADPRLLERLDRIMGIPPLLPLDPF